MALELFGHAFSSYTWKVLIPLYENAIPFTFHALRSGDAESDARFTAAWPIGKFPLLIDKGVPVMETSIIIEHLQRRHPGPVRFIPDDPERALQVRMLDRIFDNHVMGQMQRVVNDALRPPERCDAVEVEQAKAALDRSYDWLETYLDGREWAAGDFSLADCAAAPSLFYADWVHEIGARANLAAYRARLLARPSVARAVDDARPFRAYFPLGAPDRD